MGEFVEEHARRAGRPPFGGAGVDGGRRSRRDRPPRILPYLRGAVSSNRRVDRALRQLRRRARRSPTRSGPRSSARSGTSCPDHFLRTRISPDVRAVGSGDAKDSAALQAADRRARSPTTATTTRPTTSRSRSRTRRRCATRTRRSSSIPGLGLFGFGKDKREARITTEFFVNAIHVMAGANALEERRRSRRSRCRRRGGRNRRAQFKSFHNYVALPRLEAFRIEYWALEEAKLQRMPPEREFSRKIALVVGGGSGIGREVALQLAQARRARRRRRPERRGARRTSADGRAQRRRRRRWCMACGARSRRRATPSRRRCARPCWRSAASTSSSTPRRSIRRRTRHAGRSTVWAQALPINVTQQLRAGAGSGEDPEGAEPARVDRADQLGERGRARSTAASRTT